MKINPNVVCELVGDDVVVLDPENLAVVTLAGDSAGVVRRVLAGEKVSEGDSGVDELLAQGVLVSESSIGLSRRSLVMSGAAVGVGGAFALSLPAAASASSSPGLLTPVFTTMAGKTYISDKVDGNAQSGPGVTNSGSLNQFAGFEFEAVRFDNRGEFPAGTVLQWSFSSSGGQFRDFTEASGKYSWDNGGVNLDIPEANLIIGQNFLKVFIRAAADGLLSDAVEVQFLWED
jgi:hypothetical protein